MNTSGFWYSFLQRTTVGRAVTTLYWRVSTVLSAQHAGYSRSKNAEKLRPMPYGYGYVNQTCRKKATADDYIACFGGAVVLALRVYLTFEKSFTLVM